MTVSFQAVPVWKLIPLIPSKSGEREKQWSNHRSVVLTGENLYSGASFLNVSILTGVYELHLHSNVLYRTEFWTDILQNCVCYHFLSTCTKKEKKKKKRTEYRMLNLSKLLNGIWKKKVNWVTHTGSWSYTAWRETHCLTYCLAESVTVILYCQVDVLIGGPQCNLGEKNSEWRE